MDCKSLLEVMPVTEQIVVFFSGGEIARGTASEVAMDLPNCILRKEVSSVYCLQEPVGAHLNPCVAICLKRSVE